jgi:hypothetical protein
LRCQNIVDVVLCAATIGSSEFFDQICQGRDFFILDLMAIVKICLVDLFMKYINLMNNYHHEHFQVFYDVVENIFATINQDWIIDSYIST